MNRIKSGGVVGIIIVGIIVLSAGMAFSWFIEPDNIFYGHLYVDDIPLTGADTAFSLAFEVNGVEIAEYTMGDKTGDHYVLTVHMFSPNPYQSETRPTGYAKAGDAGLIKIKQNGEVVKSINKTLVQRGAISQEDVVLEGIAHLNHISPGIGKTDDTIVLTGANFGSARGASEVFFGTQCASNYLSWSDSEIRVEVPSLYLNTYSDVDVKVRVSTKDTNTRKLEARSI